MLQYFNRCLEEVEEFSGLHDNFETFTLYRGKKSLNDEDDEASRMAGYFKVTCYDCVTRYDTTRHRKSLTRAEKLTDRQLPHETKKKNNKEIDQ